ncbi:MAG: adenylate/guanylate cyclase domain-containing protein [Candidatus Riflebacteria bacterium]|nr:adenylate/guanylate cyclase domain-containing protein [Candidatus Riflebacteria bacterium]
MSQLFFQNSLKVWLFHHFHHLPGSSHLDDKSSVPPQRWLANRLGTPLSRMSLGLEKIAGGNLEVSVREFRGDELGMASRAMDGMTEELRERRKLTRFVTPQVMQIIAKGNLHDAVRGQRQNVAVLCSDIRNFTTLSESHSPKEIFLALNEHIKAMTEVIHGCGGVVDRFIGDAVVAVFYFVQGAGHVNQALNASRKMMAKHRELIKERIVSGKFSYEIGIGIERGDLLVGVLGEESVRLDFTVFGNPINRAAELENLSKEGTSTKIIISESVRKSLPNETVLPVGSNIDVWELQEGPGWPNLGTNDETCHSRFITTGLSDSLVKKDDKKMPVDVVPENLKTNLFEQIDETANKWNWKRFRNPLIWFLPLVVAIGCFYMLYMGHNEDQRQRAFQLIKEDLDNVMATADRETQMTSFFRKTIREPLASITEPLTWPFETSTLASQVANLADSACASFSGTLWGYIQLPDISGTCTARFEKTAFLTATGASEENYRTEPLNFKDLKLTDIGGSLPPGTISGIGTETMELSAGGYLIGTRWDSCFFAWQNSEKIQGIETCIQRPYGPSGYSVAGLMVRSSGSQGDAPSIFFGWDNNDRLVYTLRDDQSDLAYNVIPIQTGLNAIWIRLQKIHKKILEFHGRRIDGPGDLSKRSHLE